ncbi:MAG: hypothetical protein LBL94_05780 [Prevotellaceae bacterium]|jgi:hypothetical protein|nr:hypothetical protein [Prevotellaceae bacterium]
MYRTGDRLLSYPTLACYNQQMGKKFHVAAHSALEEKHKKGIEKLSSYLLPAG